MAHKRFWQGNIVQRLVAPCSFCRLVDTFAVAERAVDRPAAQPVVDKPVAAAAVEGVAVWVVVALAGWVWMAWGLGAV